MALYKLDEVWHDDSEKTLWRRVREGFEELIAKLSSLIVSGLTKTDSLLVGNYNTTPVSGQGVFSSGSQAYISIRPSNNPELTASRSDDSSTGLQWNFIKTRGSLASPTNISSGDDIFLIRNWGRDSNGASVEASRITFDTTGTIATSRVPGVIRFYAHPDSTASINEIMNVTDSGVNILTGKILKFGSVFQMNDQFLYRTTSPSLSTISWSSMSHTPVSKAMYEIVVKVNGDTLCTIYFVYTTDISGITVWRGSSASVTNHAIASVTSTNVVVQSSYTINGIVSVRRVM